VKRLFLTAFLLIAAVLLLYWGIQSPGFDAFLQSRIPGWAARAGFRVELAELDFDLRELRVRCADLRVSPLRGEWSFSARSAAVALDLPRSLAGTPHLSLEADRPIFQGVLQEKEEERAFDLPRVVLDRVRLSDGAASVRLPALDLAVHLPSIQVDWRRGAGRAELQGGELLWHGEQEPIHEAVLVGSREVGITRIERLLLRTERVELEGSGRLGLEALAEGSLSARLSARGLPEAWLAALRLSRYAPVEGTVSVEGRLTGRLFEEPRFRGSVNVSSGRFGPVALEGAGFAVDADRQGLSFRDLWVRSDVGRGEKTRGRLSWSDGLRLKAAGERLECDVRPFMALFVDGFFPVGLVASGSFEVDGPLYPKLALACRVDAVGRDLDVTTESEGGRETWFALPSGKVSARCVVRNRDLSFGSVAIEADSAALRVSSGRIVYDTGLTFDTELEVRNLSLVRRYLPEGFDARGVARGRFGGPYRELTFAYGIDLASTLVFHEELGRLSAKAEYDLRDLTVEQGVLQGPLGQLAASGTATLRAGGALAFDVAWSDGDLARLAGAGRRFSEFVPREVAGTASAIGRVTGTLASPVFAGEIAAERVQIGGRRAEEARAVGTFGLELWEAERFSVRAYGAELTGAGRGDREVFEASARVQELSLASLAELAGRQLPLEGVFDGQAEAEGTYDNPTVQAKGRLRGVAVEGELLGDAALQARLAGRRLEAEVSAFGGAATARGELGLEEPMAFEGHFALDALPGSAVPRKFLPPGLEASSISGRGLVEGTLVDRELSRGSFEGSLEGLRVRDLEVGTLRLSGERGEGGDSVAASAWGGEVRLRGRAEALESPWDVTVTLDDFDLARFSKLTQVGSGRVRAEGRAVVDLGQVASSEGWGRLDALSELSVAGSGRDLLLPAGVLLPAVTFSLDTPAGLPRLRLDADGARVEAALDDREKLAWSANAEFSRFALERLWTEGSPAAPLRGSLTGRVRAQGEGTEFREGSGSGAVQDLAWSPLAPSGWTWSAEYREGELLFRAREPRGVDVEGTWRAGEALTARALLDTVPLAGWTVEGVLPADLEGAARGRAELSLKPGGKPAALLHLDRLLLVLPPVRARNSGDVVLSYQEGEIRVDALSLEGEGFDATASGSLAPGSRWDLEVRGKSDLSVAARTLPKLRSASGTALVDLFISGPWAAPTIEGPVEILSGARMSLDGLDVPVEDLDARGYLDGPRGFVLEWLDAQVGEEGRLHVEGRIGLNGLRPTDLRLFVEARGVEYERPKQVTYEFDADLRLSGSLARPEVRGEVQLKSLLYARRLHWRTMALDLLRRRPEEVERRTAAGDVYVDLAISGSQDLHVDNNLADLRLGVDLRARGFLPEPELLGRVEILGGTLRFRSREYEALSSAVEFLGEIQPVPILDLHARTTVRQYLVSVDVSGPLDNYQVNLASVPAVRDPTELVALLAVGTDPREAVPAEAVTAAEATSFLTGQLQDVLESEVSGLLGFEQFYIEPIYSAVNQTSQPKVTVGKTITKKLFARYSAALGGETEQDLELQYTLTPRIQLLGTWSDEGSQSQGSLGGEIRFRFTFR
jgi:autotransporter translocation and assembly factor TamB